MKFAYILRGLPGSQRAICAGAILNSLSKNGQEPELVEAKVDDPRDKKLFDAAHKEAFKKFCDAIKSGRPVVVNHSNLKAHHYYHYVDFAQRNEYCVLIVIAPVNNLSDRELARASNISELAIRQMRDSFEWELRKPIKKG